MLYGHTYELLTVLIILVVLGGGLFLLVRVGARSAAREYARATTKTKEEEQDRGTRA